MFLHKEYFLSNFRSICSIVADFLATKSFYSSLDFQNIAVRLSMDHHTFYENILHTILRDECKTSQDILDGFISLGVQIGVIFFIMKFRLVFFSAVL